MNEGALPEQPPSVRVGQAAEGRLSQDDARGKAVGVPLELVMSLLVEVEIVEAVEEQDHVRLVPQNRLVEVDEVVMGPAAGDRGIDHLDGSSAELGPEQLLQVRIDGLGVLEDRVGFVDMRPQPPESIRRGGAHQEDPVGPGRLGHTDLRRATEAFGVVPYAAGIDEVGRGQDVLVRVEGELVEVRPVVPAGASQVDSCPKLESCPEEHDQQESRQDNFSAGGTAGGRIGGHVRRTARPSRSCGIPVQLHPIVEFPRYSKLGPGNAGAIPLLHGYLRRLGRKLRQNRVRNAARAGCRTAKNGG